MAEPYKKVNSCIRCGATHQTGGHSTWKCNNCCKWWCNKCNSGSSKCPFCESRDGNECAWDIVDTNELQRNTRPHSIQYTAPPAKPTPVSRGPVGNTILYGVVKTIKRNSGFGFILQNSASADVFFHFADCYDQVDGFNRINEGDQVSYKLQDTSKGLFAVDVKKK